MVYPPMILHGYIGGFQLAMGVPQNRWFVMEPINMDDN